MTDNKLTDEQIIKALECCIDCKCKECPCYKNIDGEMRCTEIDEEEILDLINRLKSQNKEFDEKIVIQMGTIDWQAKEINRQKAEVEKLNAELVGMRGACESYKMHYDNAQAEIERLKAEIRNTDNILNLLDRPLVEVKSEAIKEFAKRLKSVLIMYTYQNFDGVIDNLVKEMVGEKDV